MNKFVIFLSLFNIISCSKMDDCCSTINAEFFLKVTSSDGLNLVSKEFLSGIRLYYIDSKGNKKLYFDENWDNPNSIHIKNEGKENLFVVNPPIPPHSESRVSTIIEWGGKMMLPDTLEISYKIEGSSLYLSEIYFDEKIVCTQPTGCVIEIKK